ncbi:MAG TPA: SEC59/DGK1/VTE5 family protein [Methanomassiliicoccales archaeon]|nr:SEC59/DGK1/VTE5 family protein [Methanomassiliicoccales archaeon]
MIADGDLIGLAAVYLYVAVVVIMAARLAPVQRAGVQRKFVHVMVGNIVLIWWIFQTSYVMALLAAAPFIPLLLLASSRSPSRKVRGSFLGRTTGESHDLGLVYYAISWTILALLLFDNRLVASIAIVAMSYGDGMGGLIGKRYGRHVLLGKKTLEGTLTVFAATAVASFAIILFYGSLASAGLIAMHYISPALAAGVSLAAGVFVAALELLTPGQFDNLTIPLGTAALLLLLGV